jgi:hypothetical protein
MAGFGTRRGAGHLNPFGPEIYAQVLVDIIEQHLPAICAGKKVAC